MLEASPGERLRTLRELLGLTQTQLAKVAGVPQSWISYVENSRREATRKELEKIAAATGTPVKFFYVQPSSIPLDSLRFRKNASASKTVERRIQAFYSESYRITDEIVVAEKYPAPPLPYATAEQLSQDDIERLAEETRSALRLAPDKPIPHITRALERGGVAVAPFVLEDFVSEEQSATMGHFGVSYWGGVGSTALIGYFPGRQGDRDRFTLGHELGHLVLHTFRPRAMDPEDEANRFAGAFLVPRSRVLEEISEQLTLSDYARLKAKWGVSIQALIMRGYALGVIGETRRRSLFVQLSAKGWRKREPVSVGQEEPLLIWTLLKRRYGQKPYIRAAEDLAIHPTVLRSIAPTPRAASAQAIDELPSGNIVQLRRTSRSAGIG